MKNVIIFLTALLALGHTTPAQAALNIFACEPEWAALAKDIGGDHVDVTSATKGTEDPHHVRAKPSLLAAMRRADMVFCTGAGLEAGWLPVLMQQAASANVQPGKPGHLIATDHVTLMDKPESIDRAMGDIHPEGNPHIQTDPRNILIVAKVLTERLQQLDPKNKVAYKTALSSFTSRWNTAMKGWDTEAAKLEGLPVVVYHDSWNYMNRWLGLNKIATLEVKPGIPPTPSHLQNILMQSKAANVKLILLAPFDDDDAAQWLSKQTGARIVRLPFTVGGTDGTDTLEALFDQTLASLNGAGS